MISIIIPTYNEKNSILNTIGEIKKYLSVKHEILVMDDDSKDKTWKVVNDAKIDSTKAIRRTKNKSLSAAVIDGFEIAKYENLLVLDADGQHDPSIIPKMLEHIQKNDFVSGSRYTKGGSVQNWPKKRIFASKSAAMLTKLALKTKITDPMSGFFMTKKKVYNQIKKQLSGRGYKIFLEMLSLYENKQEKVSLKEIPYKFRTRKQDKSKLGIKTIIDYLIMIAKLTLKNNTLIKFLIVGLTGVIVNMFFLWLLTEQIGIYYVVSGIISTELAILNNFFLNNFWTWKKRNKKHHFIKRLLSFNAVSIIGLIITVSSLYIFTELFAINYLISNLIGIALATTWNYLANDKYTFKTK